MRCPAALGAAHHSYPHSCKAAPDGVTPGPSTKKAKIRVTALAKKPFDGKSNRKVEPAPKTPNVQNSTASERSLLRCRLGLADRFLPTTRIQHASNEKGLPADGEVTLQAEPGRRPHHMAGGRVSMK